jgi:hypothetical protein
MATRNDSRVARTVVRGNGNHARIQRFPRVPRKSARNPSASKPGSRGCDPQDPLADIIRYLKVIGAIAITASWRARAGTLMHEAQESGNVRDIYRLAGMASSLNFAARELCWNADIDQDPNDGAAVANPEADRARLDADIRLAHDGAENAHVLRDGQSRVCF